MILFFDGRWWCYWPHRNTYRDNARVLMEGFAVAVVAVVAVVVFVVLHVFSLL